jgi:hypothetical protein
MLVVPFRVFGPGCSSPGCYHPRVVLFWDWLLVQRSLPGAVSPLSVRRSHSAVSRFRGFVVFPHRAPPITVRNQSNPLVEFRLPLESHPASPSQRAAAPRLLSWASGPFSTSGIEGPLTRVRPPASFRLQGLATLLAVSSLRTRAGSVSHRQRSWDSPFEAFPSRKVSGALPPG